MLLLVQLKLNILWVSPSRKENASQKHSPRYGSLRYCDDPQGNCRSSWPSSWPVGALDARWPRLLSPHPCRAKPSRCARLGGGHHGEIRARLCTAREGGSLTKKSGEPIWITPATLHLLHH